MACEINSVIHLRGMTNTRSYTCVIWPIHTVQCMYVISRIHTVQCMCGTRIVHTVTTVIWLALTVHEIILLEGWHHKHFTQMSSIYDLLRFFKIKIIFNDRCFIKEQFVNWFLNKSVLSFNIKHIGLIYLIIQTGKIIQWLLGCWRNVWCGWIPCPVCSKIIKQKARSFTWRLVKIFELKSS